MKVFIKGRKGHKETQGTPLCENKAEPGVLWPQANTAWSYQKLGRDKKGSSPEGSAGN